MSGRSDKGDRSSMKSTSAGPVVVAGIRLSHADRLIYPDLSFSKFQLARYYDDIARWIMPHVRGRPLTLVHCPAASQARACT